MALADCAAPARDAPGWRALREVCTRADAQASRLRERGAPQLLLRLRTRYALLAALALFALLLFGGNLFIWSFEVTGNETVPTETILRALEKCGVAVGSQGLKIHQEDVRNRALLELPDVAWLAVNVRGCVAHVQVVERKRPPAVVQESQVCNVAARRGACHARAGARRQGGRRAGERRDGGELLISGVADSRRSAACPAARDGRGLGADVVRPLRLRTAENDGKDREGAEKAAPFAGFRAQADKILRKG